MYIYLDPQTTVFFGQFAYDRIFWSYGIYAKISNSKLHACGGNHDTSIFPICFQYVLNIFQYFFNIVQSCNFSIGFQYVSNIYQYSSSMPLVAKYSQIWAYDQEKLSFLQIRQYSRSNNCKKMVIRCSRYIYIYACVNRCCCTCILSFFAMKYRIGDCTPFHPLVNNHNLGIYPIFSQTQMSFIVVYMDII